MCKVLRIVPEVFILIVIIITIIIMMATLSCKALSLSINNCQSKHSFLLSIHELMQPGK